MKQDLVTSVNRLASTVTATARAIAGLLVALCVVLGVLTFSTIASAASAPAISEESVSNITATEAAVSAQVDPGGEPASYWVESAPGGRTAQNSLPASATPVEIRIDLTGLTPATKYQLSVHAQNEQGSGEGATIAFATPLANAATVGQLPDDRGYELVSPANSREAYLPVGENLGEEDLQSSRPYRASADGDAVTYAGEPPVSGEGGNGSEGAPFGNEYLSIRGPRASASGWETSDITPLARNVESRYEAFSDDLSVGVFYDPNSDASLPPLTQAAPSDCNMLYSRAASGFTALFDKAAVQTPGFCGNENEPLSAGGNEGTASVPAFTRLILETGAALTSESTETGREGEENLYISSGGTLRAVNVVDGRPLPGAVFGGPAGYYPTQSDFGGVISADGSRVFWSGVQREGGEMRPTALYAREDPLTSGASTVQLDEAQAGAAGPSGSGQFWAASSDGTRVFFTDCNPLVAGATADNAHGCYHGGEQAPLLAGADLYEYDFSKPVGQRLTDLTVDHNDPEGAAVQGVVAASADGEYVYFVADGVLATNENANHETAQTGAPNLYILHRNAPTEFIATLAPGDDHIQGYGGALSPSGDWRPELGVRTAEVTPDGRSLVFETHRPLTGYDNAAANSREGENEVFLYHASTGHLTCVSCSPTGEAVTSDVHDEGGTGTYLQTSESSTFMHRWINESGTRVFFDTAQPLVPQDTNGREDVYEWESEGEGSCPVGSPNGGCVYLVSGGNSTDQSVFVDASAGGEDVFFMTRGQLVPQDRDTRMDLYDARVDGGFTETALACTGTGCQGVPALPPIFATPASVTFAGPGNFPLPAPAAGKPRPKAKKPAAKCKRGYAKRKGRCVKSKHRRKQTKRSAKGRK